MREDFRTRGMLVYLLREEKSTTKKTQAVEIWRVVLVKGATEEIKQGDGVAIESSSEEPERRGCENLPKTLCQTGPTVKVTEKALNDKNNRQHGAHGLTQSKREGGRRLKKKGKKRVNITLG